MVELLQKLELNKLIGETPHEFEKRAKQKFPELSNHIDYITNTYCSVRFAHKTLDANKKENLVNFKYPHGWRQINMQWF